ncbi:hypothetical protein PFICI_13447 [Pestalotiopsis fici W106-1]|uniref:Uncharacterized protein n=1 Tax=Pestalotiopsis fici (strain W106-1 / CGMCC3.15140) TaxID=1229662 RepID=W3WM63_PESFW|nr:uncharacterized protein PFICI_13447 [Pestalotiopsis fici W106-1]ETS74963.1 hypothetical protein PFICI_13447 [Pestalotiopsis fici W106-1]
MPANNPIQAKTQAWKRHWPPVASDGDIHLQDLQDVATDGMPDGGGRSEIHCAGMAGGANPEDHREQALVNNMVEGSEDGYDGDKEGAN